jgi:hypothetical protein
MNINYFQITKVLQFLHLVIMEYHVESRFKTQMQCAIHTIFKRQNFNKHFDIRETWKS